MVDETRTRHWLSNLARPERLAGPEMTALLRAHGRAVSGSPLEAGRAAAQLIADSIEALAPPDGRSPAALPYRVLTTCFVEGAKNRQAAARLGLSERQLTRERSRAIALLAEQLAPPQAGRGGLPPPVPVPFLTRPSLAGALSDAVAASGRACLSGPAGCGKTALVAAYASGSRSQVFWYRGVPGSARLPAILFELGEHLAVDDPALATYVRGALPGVDVGLATRIALSSLARRPRLLVLDGVAGSVEPAVGAFLDAVVAAVPGARVVVVTRAARGRRCLRVPPLSPRETRAMLALHGVPSDDRLVATLHALTAGNAGLVSSCASWLRPEAPVRAPLDDALRRPAFLLANLRGLARSAGYGRSVSSIS
jgi:hypothetical protein